MEEYIKEKKRLRERLLRNFCRLTEKLNMDYKTRDICWHFMVIAFKEIRSLENSRTD